MNAFEIKDLNIYYKNKEAIKNMNLDIEDKKITAIIGPSGCGKTTFLLALNRMIEEKNAQLKGSICLYGTNIASMDINHLRKKVGILFQNPSPFPLSIEDNIQYAPRFYGLKKSSELSLLTRKSLEAVGLYDEVYNKLKDSALELSGGQQQRLCLARSLAVDPSVILLDEPCSALDIKSTKIIEDLLVKLSRDYTIIIVTHNLAQAKRISHNTAFILNGELIEYNSTRELFENPQDERTKDYIEGVYG